MLCYRCEYRAMFLEKRKGYIPRAECKDNGCKFSCYAYCPVKPLVLEPTASEKLLMKKGIKRGVGGYLGGRMRASDIQPNFETVCSKLGKDQYLIENRIKNKDEPIDP